ncbi:MAG TPA: hypothetical protein VGD42_13925 [Lysobacter sp.]
MRSIHPRGALVAALVLACCPMSQAQSPVQDDAIVFGRAVYNPDSTSRASSLFLVDPEGVGVRTLTPQVDGVFDVGAQWSPSGRFVAFVHSRIGEEGTHIRLIPRSATQSRALTREPGEYGDLSWGPGALIAFSASTGTGSCTELIDWRGQSRRELFCPSPRTGQPTFVDRARWSADGMSLYIPASYLLGRIDPIWVSLVYRVDVATGAATVLTRQEFFDSQAIAVAPDGGSAVYSRSGLVRVDFDDDTRVSLGSGDSPVYSHDGTRIAFTRQLFSGPPEFISHEQVFVMDADGGNVRQLTDEPIDRVSYTAAQWSRDGTQLLVHRTRRPEEGVIGQAEMRIVDVASGAMRSLAEGNANDWFQR